MNHRIQTPVTLRGRVFTASDIDFVTSCVNEFFEEGRTRISKEICLKLEWKQPNGWPKDRACRDVLIQLERMGVIELPPPKNKQEKKTQKKSKEKNLLDDFDLETPITSFPETIELEFAKSNKAERIWNQLVERYHYLGHKVIVGRAIKYLFRFENRLLGAIAFSSATWHLSSRNQIMQELGFAEQSIRDVVINNSRFLILPNVQVPHLASKILSLATNQVTKDWSWYYAIEPQIVETFVEPSRFVGTCYIAANWLEIGLTKGYAKKGAAYHNSQEPKKIFIYGLNRKTRSKLAKLELSAGVVSNWTQ